MLNREIATKTLAQIYLRQGNPQKALEIYLKILEREPGNFEISEAIKNLKHEMDQNSHLPRMDSSEDLPEFEKIRNLERWRENIRMVRQKRKSQDKD